MGWTIVWLGQKLQYPLYFSYFINIIGAKSKCHVFHLFLWKAKSLNCNELFGLGLTAGFVFFNYYYFFILFMDNTQLLKTIYDWVDFYFLETFLISVCLRFFTTTTTTTTIGLFIGPANYKFQKDKRGQQRSQVWSMDWSPVHLLNKPSFSSEGGKLQSKHSK